MKSKIGMLSVIAAIMGGEHGNGYHDVNNLTPKDIDVTPKDTPIPKGCKRYYYNKEGLCTKNDSKIYFDALKPSNAYKKYQKWLEVQ